MTDTPYLRSPAEGHCELCWRRPVRRLARIELAPPAKGPPFRAARVVYVCDRHPGELAVGDPVATPQSCALPGTTRLRPQPLALFDDTALARGGRRA